MNATPNAQQLFEQACEHISSGRRAQAQAACEEILAADAGHADALHLLGVIALQGNNAAAAAELIRRAIAVRADQPMYHSNLGNALMMIGQRDEAITHFRRAVELRPDFADAHCNLGAALMSTGLAGEAIESYQRALTLKPGLIQAQENLVAAHVLIGNHFRRERRFDQAMHHYERAVSLSPQSADCHYKVGSVFHDAGRFEDAIAWYEKALALDTNHVNSRIDLANALFDLGRLDEAIASYKHVAEMTPDSASAHSNLGNALLIKGPLDEATSHLNRAIALQADFAPAHWNLGLILLLRGDFAQGWREYEWRRKLGSLAMFRREFSQPQWQGEELAGRTILLHAEQGFGDAIQFVRFADDVAKRGGKIIIECRAELARLIRSLDVRHELVIHGEQLPSFDLHCPLMSLPLALGVTLETLPRPGRYLQADPADIAFWHAKLSKDRSALKVGLAWAGNPAQANDRYRSTTLAAFAPLAAAPGVSFYSLQKGEKAAQAKMPPGSMVLTDYTSELRDFADTAALMANLDLIISVDTGVAHLAGALRRPVWTLLSFRPDWRWLLDREDSPWYPSMKLFRQQEQGDWAGVIDRVNVALRAMPQKGT